VDNRTEANTKVFGQGTQRVALPEPSLQTRGQAFPMFTFSHQVGAQRVALPEPNLQTRATRQCLQAEYFHRAWGQLVWLNSAWKYDKASALFPAVGGQFGQVQICGVECQNFTRTCHAFRPKKAETAF